MLFGEHAVLCPEACLGHVVAICIRGILTSLPAAAWGIFPPGPTASAGSGSWEVQAGFLPSLMCR